MSGGVRFVVSGCVEAVSRQSVDGWIMVDDQPLQPPHRLILKMANETFVHDGSFRLREDLGGKRCGFSFRLPAAYQGKDFRGLVGEYDGVFMVSENGQYGDVRIHLHKTSLLTASTTAHRDERRRPQRRLEILVRTHLDSPKLRDLCLKLGQLRGASVTVCADETAGPKDFGPLRKITHSVNDLADLGYPIASAPNALFFYGDLPFYKASIDMPRTDFFLMIEYDVDFDDRGLDWMQVLIRRLSDPSKAEIDFFAPKCLPADPAWYWYEHAAALLPNHKLYNSFFPIIGLSRAAIAYLAAHRQKTRWVELPGAGADAVLSLANGIPYCEYFVPTIIANSGLFSLQTARTLGLPDDDTICGDYTVQFPLLFGTHDTTRSAIRHPVLDEPTFLSKVRQFAQAEQDRSARERMTSQVARISDLTLRQTAMDIMRQGSASGG